jgi:hypothetical protein
MLKIKHLYTLNELVNVTEKITFKSELMDEFFQ